MVKRKKEDNLNDSNLSRYSLILNGNIKFIESVCNRIVYSKGYFHDSKIAGENESIELFNLVIDKLKKDNFKILRNFSGRSKLSTYISAVISFAYVDMVRKKRGRSRREDRNGRGPVVLPPSDNSVVKSAIYSGVNGEFVVPDKNSDPEYKMLEKERSTIEEKAFEKISELLNGEDKLLLRMRFPERKGIDPFPVKKISLILGISEKAVYKRIKVILAKCRKILNDAGINTEDLFLEKK